FQRAGALRVIPDTYVRNAVRVRLFRQKFDIIIGGEADNAQAVGEARDDVERLRADGAGRAEEDDVFHRRLLYHHHAIGHPLIGWLAWSFLLALRRRRQNGERKHKGKECRLQTRNSNYSSLGIPRSGARQAGCRVTSRTRKETRKMAANEVSTA